MTSATSTNSTDIESGNRASYAGKAKDKAHEQVDKLGERAARAEEQIRDKAGKLRENAEHAGERAGEMSDEATKIASSYVKEHPIASLAIAFGAGVVLSALMRR